MWCVRGGAALGRGERGGTQAALSCFHPQESLQTKDGMRRAFSRLRDLIATNGEEREEKDEEATRRQLLALSGLLTEWRRVLSAANASDKAAKEDPPLLHAECAELLQLAIRLCGASVLADVRRGAAAARADHRRGAHTGG